MAKPSKYNFRKKENIGKAVYKLVLYPKNDSNIRGSYINSKGNRVLIFYGYYNKPDFGLQGLRILLQRYKPVITSAMIYAKPGLNANHYQFEELVEIYKS